MLCALLIHYSLPYLCGYCMCCTNMIWFMIINNCYYHYLLSITSLSIGPFSLFYLSIPFSSFIYRSLFPRSSLARSPVFCAMFEHSMEESRKVCTYDYQLCITGYDLDNWMDTCIIVYVIIVIINGYMYNCICYYCCLYVEPCWNYRCWKVCFIGNVNIHLHRESP